jgi:hypothetical protein
MMRNTERFPAVSSRNQQTQGRTSLELSCMRDTPFISDRNEESQEMRKSHIFCSRTKAYTKLKKQNANPEIKRCKKHTKSFSIW